MTPQELLKPRAKCMAIYPHSPFIIGYVYTKEECCEILNPNNIHGCMQVFDWLRYPAIFKEIFWWEDRKLEDMPEYLKYQTSQETRPFVIYPAKFTKDGDGWMVEVEKYIIPHGNYLNDKLPATLEEYLNQSK